MLRIPASLLVLLMGALALAQGDAADPARVDEAIKQLRSKYYDERKSAKEELIQIGDAAIPRVVETLKDDDYRARTAACEILGVLKRPQTLDPLVAVLADEDETVRKAAIDAVIAFGDAGREALAKAAAGNPAIAATVEDAMTKFSRVQVERLLDTRITRRGGFGFYKDQFAQVLALGKPAVEVLVEMFVAPEYDFQVVTDPGRQDKLRILAGEALGDSGDKGIVPRLKAFMDAPEQSGIGIGSNLVDAARYSLFKLGEPSYMEAKKQQILSMMGGNDARTADFYRAQLAEVHVRMGEIEQAEAEYQKFVAQSPNDSHAAYNLSCIYALRGKKDLAVRTLKEAVDLGFDDYEWIRLDRDLEAIHGEEGYKAILGGAPREDDKDLPPPDDNRPQ